MASAIVIPTHRQILWPTLRAFGQLGGSGSISEINDAVLALGHFSEEQQSKLHGEGPATEIEYRIAWARTDLKRLGLLDNSARGVWSLTDRGRNLLAHESEEELVALHRDHLRQRPRSAPSLAASDDDDEGSTDWKTDLLQLLLELSPDRFERLARRVLREAGFVSVRVTGQSGDGGIDGLGVYRLSLVSFPVFFQCKRYRGSVSTGAVRDFRGAMTGRGDKGLLITTGTFTADAKREATREGAPPIDLIDGERLCDLLKEFGIGVSTTTRTVEDVVVDPRAFDDI